jgi:hypothetical protein
MNNKYLIPKVNNKKINDIKFNPSDFKQQLELVNFNEEKKCNDWLNSQEINSDGLKYKWINDSVNEPPKNWFNKDITQINNFINNNNLSFENSLTPGTTLYENKKYYNSYEDWFFDHYKPIYNKDTIKKIFNEIMLILEDNNYKINDIKSFKNNLINFIYKYST